jgi:hypothetical protein
MAWTGLPDRDAVVAFAQREVSPEHHREFEPITRGPAVAILLLIPLGLLAGAFVVAGRARALFTRALTWRSPRPST